ncbi:hypothetical protein PENTCL1PPCAC_10031, partial [Pristionchus entomophagus]
MLIGSLFGISVLLISSIIGFHFAFIASSYSAIPILTFQSLLYMSLIYTIDRLRCKQTKKGCDYLFGFFMGWTMILIGEILKLPSGNRSWQAYADALVISASLMHHFGQASGMHSKIKKERKKAAVAAASATSAAGAAAAAAVLIMPVPPSYDSNYDSGGSQ